MQYQANTLGSTLNKTVISYVGILVKFAPLRGVKCNQTLIFMNMRRKHA